MDDLHYEAIATGIGSSAVTGVIFKFLLSRALADLDAAVKKLGEMAIIQARQDTRLQVLERVVQLEGRVGGGSKKKD